MAVMTYRGIVKGNTVILESAAVLPGGTEVEVRFLQSKPDLARRKAAGTRLRACLRSPLNGSKRSACMPVLCKTGEIMMRFVAKLS